METCSRSALVFMGVIYITIQALEAQEVKVQPEVTGYLGHDATLPCQFIQGPKHSSITQVQWDLRTPEGEKIRIIVSHHSFGVFIKDTFLKERVNITEYSLVIRAVEMRDAGSYTCSFTLYPSGSFEGTTNFVVQEQMPEQMPVLPRMIAAGVFVLIVVSMFASTYFIIRIRYGRSSDK